MNSNFIAHRTESGREQDLLEHLEGTAKLAERFAEEYGAGQIGYQVGRYHDVGKYADKFQQYIRGEFQGRVDHSTAGAQLLSKDRQSLAQALCVAGHHAGLPDLGSRIDSEGDPTFCGRMKRKVPDFSAYLQENKEPLSLSTPKLELKAPFSFMFYTRMLFSCLVDGDFLDTESFMQLGTVKRDGFAELLDMAESFKKSLQEKGFLSPNNELNEKRAEILRRCLEAGAGERGLYSLTVPTGGGKTIASSAFAFEQCQKQGLKRIIYVIPYTSIIEQTADVLRGFVQGAKGIDGVLEHHSAVSYDDDSENMGLKRLAVENWEAPIIITTNVQFFESLFACRTSKCRKLHNIAQSVIIFDEAQMFPVRFFKPVLAGIVELVRNYGCTCLLASATQPPWQDLFADLGAKCREIIPEIPALYEFFHRVSCVQCGMKNPEELADDLMQYRQVLCVASTKKTAKAIFEAMPDEEGNFYLSTNLCPAHRRRVIAAVRKRLAGGEACRVVSTSVISVGVDLDFPVGFVELTALDSIIQAAGRVNREGKIPADRAKVFVFSVEGASERFRKQERDITVMLQKQRENIFSPETIKEYFQRLYRYKGEALDGAKVMDDAKILAFKTIAQKVKLIDEDTIAVLIPYEEDAEKIAGRLRHGERTREVFRQAASYIVSLRRKDFDSLNGIGALEVLDSEIAILQEKSFYNEVQGLILPEEGTGIFL